MEGDILNEGIGVDSGDPPVPDVFVSTHEQRLRDTVWARFLLANLYRESHAAKVVGVAQQYLHVASEVGLMRTRAMAADESYDCSLLTLMILGNRNTQNTFRKTVLMLGRTS